MLANLKTAIAARGLRQIELAQKLQIPSDFLSRIIRSWAKPNAELRVKIAEVLQADEGWLFSANVVIPAPRPGGQQKHVVDARLAHANT
jgi:transcriptional regulator with XRE-family HTH domain